MDLTRSLFVRVLRKHTAHCRLPDFGRAHASLPMAPLPRPYAADSE